MAGFLITLYVCIVQHDHRRPHANSGPYLCPQDAAGCSLRHYLKRAREPRLAFGAHSLNPVRGAGGPRLAYGALG